MSDLKRISPRMHEGENDEVLMRFYQQGDGSALETLVRRYADPLLGFLVRMTRDRAQAEDLFQETFLRVHQKSHTFQPSLRFKSWLYAIAAHLAIDAGRRATRSPIVPSTDDDPETMGSRISDHKPTPADAVELADRKARVRRAIEKLPPRQRTTLVLAYYQDLSYAEVAQTMHCTVGTVKTQVSRALDTLSRMLSERAP